MTLNAISHESHFDEYLDLLYDKIRSDLHGHETELDLLAPAKTLLDPHIFPLDGLVLMLLQQAYRGDIESVLPIASTIEMMKLAIKMHYFTRSTDSDGPVASILFGDLLLAKSITTLKVKNRTVVMKGLSIMMVHLIHAYGEMVRIETNQELILSTETYWRISDNRVIGVLKEGLSILCSLGMIPESDFDVLSQFVEYIACAWILNEDFRAAYNMVTKGTDLQFGLLNYSVIYALENTPLDFRKIPDQTLLTCLIKKSRALEYILVQLQSMLNKARTLLERLNIEDKRDLIELLNRFATPQD